MKKDVLSYLPKAEVLVEALPYIRAFSGKYFVVKYGGQAMGDADLMDTVILDLVLMKYVGIKPILVHGGGKEVNKMMAKLGKEPHFVGGLRVTDDETMEIVEMVLMGKVNQAIVSLLNRQGAKAIGLSGRDAGFIHARRKGEVTINNEQGAEKVDLGRVGEIILIDPEPIIRLSENGYIPVISSIGTGLNSESLNINSDFVAGELAVSLEAEKLIMLTGVDGIHRGSAGNGEPISVINRSEVRQMIENGEISDGMIPKAESCLIALDGGVRRTHIIDGRLPHALILEIFTDAGIGTMVVK